MSISYTCVCVALACAFDDVKIEIAGAVAAAALVFVTCFIIRIYREASFSNADSSHICNFGNVFLSISPSSLCVFYQIFYFCHSLSFSLSVS